MGCDAKGTGERVVNNMRNIIINEILIPSLERLYMVDYNIRFKVSERNICARLALHMESKMRKYDIMNQKDLFAGYYTDVEYDKMNDGDLKHYENEQNRPQRMISNLLIHSRGIPRNYLAIEMKRKDNYNKRREDRDRLMSIVSSKPDGSTLKCVYDTLVGAFIIYSPNDVKIEIYENVDGHGMPTDEIRFFFMRTKGTGSLLRSLRSTSASTGYKKVAEQSPISKIVVKNHFLIKKCLLIEAT